MARAWPATGRRRRLRDLAVVGVVFLLAGCMGISPLYVAPQRTTIATERVVLPTVTDEGGDMLYIEARINGAGPFRLIVDTGAQALAVTQRVAQAAGIKLHSNRTVMVSNAAGGTVGAKIVNVDRLEAGGLVLEGVGGVMVEDADHADFTTISKADGILGMNALKDVVLEMDFRAKQVVVSRIGVDRYPLDRAVAYTETRPHVVMEIAGKPQSMVIDTGSNGTFSLGRLDRLPLLGPAVKVVGTGAVLGQSAGPRGMRGQLAGDIKLGPITWINPPLTGGDERTHGLIGVQALKHGKLVIHPHEHRVYFLGDELRRTWDEEKAGDPRFEVGFFAEIEGTALRLVEVDADGAADLAGLKVGDLLLSVDGTPAATPTLKSYRSRVRVKRGETEFETTMIYAPDYSPRQTILAADRVALPSSFSRGALIVEAKINGAGPFRFLVGTGAAALRVRPQVAAAAGAKALPDWPTRGAGPTANVVWLERFESGGLELRGMAATVVEPGSLAYMHANFGALDGFLGLEALKDTVLELDFPQRQVTAVKLGAENYPEERAVAYRGLTPRVTLDVAGRQQVALLDTGSAGGFDLPLLDEVPLLFPKVKSDEIGLNRTYERSERGQLSGEIHLGPVSWLRPPIAGRRVARIGAVSLGAWRLAIDQHASRIYFLDGNLQRRANEVRPAEMRSRAGYFARMEDSGLHLVEVDEGGAFARAGLRSGDVIVAVDDMPVFEYVRLPGVFSARQRSAPKVRVQREGVQFDVVLTLVAETPSL